MVDVVESLQDETVPFVGLQGYYLDSQVWIRRGVCCCLLGCYSIYGAVAMSDDVRGSVMIVTRVILGL